MKTFSVLTVTKRTGWEDMAKQSIDHQNVLPSRWVIVPESNPPFSLFYDNIGAKYEGMIVHPPEKTRVSNLNASLNAGLKWIDTDYVIFYQDFIELQEDCFENLLRLAGPNTFVTTCTPNYDGSDDGRYTGIDRPRPCQPAEWEANVAIAPMAVIRELGGFDEEYDEGWSWDNVNLAERAAMLGCDFILDESNRPKLYPHEKQRGLVLNGDFHAQTMEKIRSGEKPLRLNYL